MNTQHTKGPWINVANGGDDPNPAKLVIEQSGGTEYLIGEAFGSDMGDSEAEANARLMAASPELLEALEALVKYMMDSWGSASEEWSNAKALLTRLRNAGAR